MNYKSLLVDYDGCLVDLSYKISPRLKKVIDKIRKKILVSVATGRPLVGRISDTLDELKIAGPHILFGGGAIYDWRKRKFLSKIVIPKKEIFEIVSAARQNGFHFVCDTVDKSFTSFDQLSSENRYGPNLNYVPISPTTEQIKLLSRQGLVKIVVFVGSSPEITSKTINILSKRFQNLKFNKWLHNNVYGFDITKHSKLEAVNQYLKITKISRSELIAIGDGYNDYPLLMAAGFKVAMGNAVQEIKAIADYIAPSVDEDGAAHVIEKFVL